MNLKSNFRFTGIAKNSVFMAEKALSSTAFFFKSKTCSISAASAVCIIFQIYNNKCMNQLVSGKTSTHT